MNETMIITLLAIAIAVAALAWLLFGRGRNGGNSHDSASSMTDTRPLDQVAASIPPAPPPAPHMPVAAQGILPGTFDMIPPPPVLPVTAATDADTAGEAAADNLLMMKGVGPKLVSLLRQEGITRFEQIAAWSDADIDAIDARLGTFKGRIRRDNWVDQARYLAADDKAGYETKDGKL